MTAMMEAWHFVYSSNDTSAEISAIYSTANWLLLILWLC
jgi:hypothetical protein